MSAIWIIPAAIGGAWVLSLMFAALDADRRERDRNKRTNKWPRK